MPRNTKKSAVKRSLRIFVGIVLVATSLNVYANEKVDITPDVVYGHKDGLALTFDVFTPKPANGAGVLFMVSGGWYSRWAPPEQTMQLFKPLIDKGFTVFAVRHGSSPRYVVPEAIEDVRRSVRYIRSHAKRFGVNEKRLGVFGGSAGGHLSLMLGMTSDQGNPDAKDDLLKVSNQVSAVVAYFPPTDLREFVKETSRYYKNYPALRFDASKAPACSPLLHVSADDPPTLLVHGDKDQLVPIEHSEKILAEMQKNKVISKLLVIEGAAHGFKKENNLKATNAMVAWFEKHLLPQ